MNRSWLMLFSTWLLLCCIHILLSLTHSLSDKTFLQAVFMFLGELSCLAVFYILICHDRRNPEPRIEPGQSFNPLLFLPPAICDMAGTSIMYVGKKEPLLLFIYLSLLLLLFFFNHIWDLWLWIYSKYRKQKLFLVPVYTHADTIAMQWFIFTLSQWPQMTTGSVLSLVVTPQIVFSSHCNRFIDH